MFHTTESSYSHKPFRYSGLLLTLYNKFVQKEIKQFEMTAESQQCDNGKKDSWIKQAWCNKKFNCDSSVILSYQAS